MKRLRRHRRRLASVVNVNVSSRRFPLFVFFPLLLVFREHWDSRSLRSLDIRLVVDGADGFGETVSSMAWWSLCTKRKNIDESEDMRLCELYIRWVNVCCRQQIYI